MVNGFARWQISAFAGIKLYLSGTIKTAGHIPAFEIEGDFMHKFTSGLLAGGIIGAAGIAWAMSDDKTRRRMTRSGKRAFRKANHMFGNVQDYF